MSQPLSTIDRHHKQRRLRDAFASAWKAIGNPGTAEFTVLVNSRSEIAQYIGFDMHYMNVLFIPTHIEGEDIGIAVCQQYGAEESTAIALKFSRAWRQYGR